MAKAAIVGGFIAVALLLAIGLTSSAQIAATMLVFFLLCAAIFSISRDPALAGSVIFVRLVVVVVSVFYIYPFFEAETGSDAQLYHDAGVQISHSILANGVVSGTGEVWGTNFYAIFTGFFYALCGASALRVMIFNSMIAALGSFLFYRTFIENYAQPHWALKYLILFDPSILYWSSIHGKDPGVFFCLGLLFRNLSKMFRTGGTKPLLLSFVALAGIFLIRPQVALVCAFAVLVTLLLVRLRSPFPNQSVKVCFRMSIVAVLASAMVVGIVYGRIEEFSGEASLTQLSTIVGGVSYGGTALDVPQISTWTDVFTRLPAGVIVVLFRPFPWETGNTFIRLAGMHQLLFSAASLLLLLGLLHRFLRARVKSGAEAVNSSMDPLTIFVILYCAFLTVLFAALVGNLGSLVRAKIQLAPFVWCAAFALTPFLCASHRTEPSPPRFREVPA
jgi:hypothetical protein